jgi:hypothetical protein
LKKASFLAERDLPGTVQCMSHQRRRHRVFCTQHTEYHLRDAECVGVRDRSSGTWLIDHAALRLHALAVPETPDDSTWIGQRLQFWGRATDVTTSPVVAIGRPRLEEVFDYVSQARSGQIHENPRSKLDASLPG